VAIAVCALHSPSRSFFTHNFIWHSFSGLNFTCIALQYSHANKDEELSASFNKSYDASLKKYHSFVVKPVFAVRVESLLIFVDYSESMNFYSLL